MDSVKRKFCSREGAVPSFTLGPTWCFPNSSLSPWEQQMEANELQGDAPLLGPPQKTLQAVWPGGVLMASHPCLPLPQASCGSCARVTWRWSSWLTPVTWSAGSWRKRWAFTRAGSKMEDSSLLPTSQDWMSTRGSCQ